MSPGFSVQGIASDRHQEKPVISRNVWCIKQNRNVFSRVYSAICFAGVSSVPFNALQSYRENAVKISVCVSVLVKMVVCGRLR